MAVLTTRRKLSLAARTGRGAARHPQAARRGAGLALTAGKPIARRKARRQARSAAHTGRSIVGTVWALGRETAQACAQVEAPEPKRTAPRLAVGALLGAGAMYLLEPATGAARRRRLAAAVGSGTGAEAVPEPPLSER